MHNLVPEYITTKLIEGEQFGQFYAAGLFVDLSGFSRITSSLMSLGQHGAEILASLMRDLFDPMINCVYQNQGFVAQISGDAFTALFPFQEDESSSPLSAVSCALTLQEIVKNKGHKKTKVGDFDISAKVGVSSGEIYWGVITSSEENRGAYYFRGPVIEGCIESEIQAAAGEIILDQAVASLLGNRIKTSQKGNYLQLTALNSNPPPEIPLPEFQPDLAISSRFYPEGILTQKRSGEFRNIVNVFINLPTVRTEPQLEIFMRSLFKLQEVYGGFLNRLDFGDKGSHLLLFWGAPITYENDIGRALNFVLALQAETSIPIKAGITYRFAHAGFIGNSLREEYTCYGEGVNLASRFMDKANRGEILVDDSIAGRVDEYFDLDLDGSFNYKGFSEPQKTYVLYERKENIGTFFKGPFLSRQEEFSKLTALINTVIIREPHKHVIIAGDPGIGKSRLVYESRLELEKQGLSTLWARCQTDQILRSSFNPIRYWVKNYFNILESQSDSRNKRNFNRKLDVLISATNQPELAIELDRTRTFLGSLVNLFWEDSLYEQVPPQRRYENTIIGLTSLLLAESLKQPVILFIEDVQWLDESSRAFLQNLNARISSGKETTYPIQILGTSRDLCEDGCLGEKILYEQIILKGLPDEEIIALAESRVDGELGPGLRDTIAGFVEGNPFFTEQNMRYLVENNKIIQTDSGWVLVDDDAILLPEDVRAVLVSRLDQAEPEINELILTASVLGKEFEVDILARMVELEEDDLWFWLKKAEEYAIWTGIGESRFVFQSNLMRDAAYQIQTLAERQSTHRQAVSAYKALYAEDQTPKYMELAFHAEKGNLIPEAIRYWRGAGTVAAQNYHNQRAIDFFSRAIVLQKETKDLEFFELLLERERMFNLTGNRQEQINNLRLADRVANILNDAGLKARSLYSMANYFAQVGDYGNALRNANESIALAQESGQHSVIADTRYLLSNCARLQGEYETSRKEASLGIEISARIEEPYGICMGLNTLSLIAIELGEFYEAADLLEHSLATAREADLPGIQAQTQNNLGNIYGELGDLSSALRVYKEALEIARKIGARMGEGLVNTNLGWISGLLGDFNTASDYFEESIKIARGIGDTYNLGYALINQGLFSCSEMKFETAIEQLSQALEIVCESGNAPGEAVALTYLGHANLGKEALPKAHDFYARGLALRREMETQNLAMEPLAGLAEIAFKEGDHTSARETISEIISFLDGGGTLQGIDQPFRIYTACAKILLALEDPDAGILIQNAYKTLLDQAKKITDPQSRRSFLTNVPWHQEMEKLHSQAKQQNLLPKS